MKQQKTNAVRTLEQKKIPFSFHSYSDAGVAKSGVEVAELLQIPPSRIYKTLVTKAQNRHYVFVIPSDYSLHLKDAARVVGEKKLEMLHVKDLLPTTGYVRGGCSPIGMKKDFPTIMQEDALQETSIYISAGRIGAQIEIKPQDLVALCDCKVENISAKDENIVLE